MKALVGAFNQEKALVGAFSVIVQPVVEPIDRFTALNVTVLQEELVTLAILCQDLPCMSLSIAAHIDQANHSSFVQFCNYLLVKLSRRRTFAICEQYIYLYLYCILSYYYICIHIIYIYIFYYIFIYIYIIFIIFYLYLGKFKVVLL